jgi:pimeloyl-ACP methyl ester carboxylesterase
MTEKLALRVWCLVLLSSDLLLLVPSGRADSVFMKNGIVYRSMGQPDKDGTLVYMWDGLRKLVVRDSKIEKIVGDNSFRTGERFQLVQPLVKYAGVMPKEVISVQAGPWNERGRRAFRYVGRSSKPVSMEQAINEIGPHVVKYRGVEEFWQGAVATSQIPRPVIMSLLARVEQENQAERERAVRFLMDAGWYPEAKQELDRVIHDFPNTDLSERARGARAFLVQAEATGRRSEIEVRKNAHQFRHVDALLKSFTEKEIGTELVVEVRELSRRLDDQHAADLGLATDLRKLEGKLPAAARAAWKKRVAEAMKAIEEAPDAVRDRFAAWRKAAYSPGSTDENKFALAISGFAVGNESAVPDLTVADLLWQARDLVREYLLSTSPGDREALVAKLDALDWPAEGEVSEGYKKLDLVTRMVQLMAPPASGQGEAKPPAADKSIIHKVVEEQDDEPTVYAVRLPPEYHPLRSYPAIVALHSSKAPESAIEFWATEAARRGYIVIATEYNLPGQPADYHYTTSEHAAVELAVRDARKRYAIDSDRVFLAGQLTGGNMAWDFALAHPDLFAGAIVVSGFPAKYVPRYLPHHERMPLFFVMGDLAPAANEIIFGTYIKPLILKAWDVTYAEYHRRGLEEFPEEITTFFDWMDRHHREPFPKAFDVVTARPCDNRFYGVVIREHSQNRTTAPEAVEMLGQNLTPAKLKMRSSNLSNLINLKADGVKKLDVWLSPKVIDFKRKLEIRINSDRPFFKGQVKLSLEPLLEDLRVRGDRQQIYWYKVAAG